MSIDIDKPDEWPDLLIEYNRLDYEDDVAVRIAQSVQTGLNNVIAVGVASREQALEGLKILAHSMNARIEHDKERKEKEKL